MSAAPSSEAHWTQTGISRQAKNVIMQGPLGLSNVRAFYGQAWNLRLQANVLHRGPNYPR
jgi:hypothetical protein